MTASILVFADPVTTGAVFGGAAAFVVLFPIAMTINRVRLKPGRPVEFADESGRIQRGTVVSYTWGSFRVRVKSADGEYDVRVKKIKPK